MHMLFENIGAALAGIKANKMRSFLTMLGILIGIAAIIAIIVVSNGMSRYIQDMVGDIGANLMEFYVTQINYDDSVEYKSSNYISQEMIQDVSQHFADEIESVSLSTSLGDGVIKEGKEYANVSVSGSNSGAINFDLDEDNILAGRMITSAEQGDGDNVAMVSEKLVNNLYNGDVDAAIGQNIDVLINNKYYTYTIVGVYQTYDTERMTTSTYDETTTVYVPLKAVHKVVSGTEDIFWFDVNAKADVDSIVLAQEISDYMNQTYYANNENFMIASITMQEQAEMINEELGMIKLVMGGIGAISLLVGGIGVMNIMIVSITERTREIGTRKALGATNGSIRFQFITESIVICTIGGMLGLLLGVLLGRLITNAIGFPGTITLENILFCLLFSIAFGVFFGYYPANRAAKMNPIDALRYE